MNIGKLGLVGFALVVVLQCFTAIASTPSQIPQNATPGNAVLTLENAEYSASDRDLRQVVSLPHSSLSPVSVYRFEFDRFIDTPIWGVFIDSRKYNVQIFVNQQKIKGDDKPHFSDANWNTPAMASFPVMLLKPTGNTLRIEVSGPGVDTTLGRVFIGSNADIQHRFKSQHFNVVVVQHLIIILTLIAGILSLILWFIRRKDFAYFWFAGGTLAWALHNIVKMTPVPFYLEFTTFQVVGNSALIWFTFLGMLFIRNIAQKHNQKTMVVLWGIHLLLQVFFVVSMVWFPVFYKNIAGPMLMIYNLLLGLYSATIVLSGWSISNTFKLLASGIIIVVLMGVNDTLNYFGIIDSLYSLQYSAPILIGVFLVSLLTRYIETVSTKEQIYAGYGVRDNDSLVLGDKVDWTELQQKDREQAAELERQKFRRDLHDGVTGSLISVISALEAEQQDNRSIILPLQQSMAELRHIIDARGFEHNELNSLLGSFRQYVQGQLDILQIGLKWQVLQLEDDITISEEQAHNLFRILQEVFTNIIKHSAASMVLFEAKSHLSEENARRVTLTITDNGKGLGAARAEGKGLRNMKQRAGQIGASIDVHDCDGTKVVITLPIR